MSLLQVYVVVKTENPLNGSHLHWRTVARRRKAQRRSVAQEFEAMRLISPEFRQALAVIQSRLFHGKPNSEADDAEGDLLEVPPATVATGPAVLRPVSRQLHEGEPASAIRNVAGSEAEVPNETAHAHARKARGDREASLRVRKRGERSPSPRLQQPEAGGLDVSEVPPRPPCGVRFNITLTRRSAGELDDDAVGAALKSVRDQVAAILGVENDRDPRYRWTYRQEKSRRGVFGVNIEISEDLRKHESSVQA